MSGKVLYSARRIAEMAGISQQMVSYVIKGDRQPSIEMSMKLEKATGVCREAWLWPERHFNPYIPFTNVMVCTTCKNRHSRIVAANKIIRRIYRETKNFDLMVEAAKTYNGIHSDIKIRIGWNEIKDDGAHLLTTPPSEPPGLPMVVSRDHIGPFYDDLMNSGFATLSCYPPNLSLPIPSHYQWLIQQGVRSGIMVAGPKRKLAWGLSNFASEMSFTQEIIDEMLDHLSKVETMWLADQASA